MKYTLMLISLVLILFCTNPSSDSSIQLRISAGNDTTVTGNDSIKFLGNVLETNADIEMFSWYKLSITRELVTQKQQLEYLVPDSLCTLSFIFQVKTIQNNFVEDTVNVYVVPETLIANAGIDQIVLINSIVVLHATHTGDSTDSTFWKIGTGQFIPSLSETSFISPGSPVFLTCVFRVKSDDKEAVDTVNIDVISYDYIYVTANAGRDTSAVTGSKIKLNGTYEGEDVTSTFWKIGGGPFISASPDTTIILPDTPTTFKCIFRVQNERFEDSDTVNINVVNNLPLRAFAFEDTTVLLGTQLKIKGSYVGKVLWLYWKIGDSPFVLASPETTITVPNSVTSFKCIFKVRDDKMNEALDTAIVTVVERANSLKANAGNNQYVSIDSIVQLAGTGVDPVNSDNTIVKYEWKYGSGLWTKSPEGKGTFKPQVPGIVVCSLRVTAKDGQVATDFCIINISSAIDMVLISAKDKTFKMGDNNNGQASPAHNVTFTKNFFMSKTEITQKEYVSLLNINPSSIKNGNYPVYNCNWFDAVYFCNAKSKKDSLDTVYTYTSVWGTIGYMCFMSGVNIDYTKKGYRLPTEAEWEFACRAGTTTKYYWGDIANGRYLWYKGNTSSKPKAVGNKLPNAFGLYDMSGSVREWCNDWFSSYTIEGKIDPKGPDDGETHFKVVRNGSYTEVMDKSASSVRDYSAPRTVSRMIGFRVVRDE